jgi:hypothetical protein
MAYARISATLPEEVLAVADRLAGALDRPRSWVIAEALRRWDGAAAPVPRVVREAAPSPYGAFEVADARRRHLAADLRRTPGERLRRAGDLARLARARRVGTPRTQIIGFDTYEDFYQWKKARRAGA